MAHILKLTKDDPVIHLKAYGGVQIIGADQSEVQCEIDAPELATLVEENGHVYVTVNASCKLTVPFGASIEIDRSMGSVKIEKIENDIQIDKVLGNLVLIEVGSATAGKVGGNFSVRKASGPVKVDKVAGNLTVDEVDSFECEKVGGSCYARDVQGDFRLEKAGGTFIAQGIKGKTSVSKVGGSFTGRDLNLQEDLKSGGKMELICCEFEDDMNLCAGGNVNLALGDKQHGLGLNVRSGAHKINIKAHGDDIEVVNGSFEYQLGDQGQKSLDIAAGGSVSVVDKPEHEKDIVGDLSDRFTFEESAFSEMIQERISSATRKSEAKIRAAEFRLDQIREKVEKQRGFNIDVDFDKADVPPRPSSPDQPAPPVSRPVGSKGATDEERLMILKMLEDSKISVDEAEMLFRSLEE